MFGFYRIKRKGWLTGVLAGIADRFQWDVRIVRAIVFAIALLSRLGFFVIVLYVLGAIFLPDKDEVEAEQYGTGPRKCKDAEKINKDSWFS